MTLIGAINSGSRKILFADRLWNLSEFKEKRKIFVDNEDNYLAVSGFILKRLITEFEENLRNKSVKSLIKSSYKNTNLPGTSFINYNQTEDSLQVYLVNNNKIESFKIINYIFLGFQVNELEGFDFRDVDHTLIPTLRKQHEKYPDYIGNTFDVLVLQNKAPIWMNVNL